MTETDRIRLIAQALAGITLLAVIPLSLLSALLAGLLIYQLVEFGTRQLARIGVIPATAKVILVIALALVIVAGFALGIAALISQLANGPESLVALLQKMADVIDSSRTHLPLWVQDYMPSNMDEWQATTSNWLRDNASHFSVFGKEAGEFLAHIIIGMIIGGVIALDTKASISSGPLAQALGERVAFLSRAFIRIVFSQARISALNTVLTAIFLLIILPMLGTPLPLAKTMVVVTFFVGLLPIIGNLISNTVIFLIGLSVSPMTAVIALGYLIVIHKLEYFINARIIGSRINARAWEILIAMVVMESAFGLPGLVAAPIYYAYLKDELSARKLI